MAETTLDAELARLATASRPDLKAGWRGAVGGEPPTSLSTDLMRRAVAFALQSTATGGSPRPCLAQLPPGAKRTPSLAPGTRLVREWGGKTHVVDVTASGLQWAGQTYRSLSEIARAITGARWSGPRFFGLPGTPPGSQAP